MAAPKGVGDDHPGAVLVEHLLLGERAAHGQRHAKRGKELRRHPVAHDALGRTGGPDDGAAPLPDGGGGEGLDNLAPVVVVGQRGAGALDPRARVRVDRGHQTGRFGKRQRTDQHGVDHRINGDIGSDAQGQREENGRGEATLASEPAQDLAKISRRNQGVHRQLTREQGIGLQKDARFLRHYPYFCIRAFVADERVARSRPHCRLAPTQLPISKSNFTASPANMASSAS